MLFGMNGRNSYQHSNNDGFIESLWNLIDIIEQSANICENILIMSHKTYKNTNKK